MKLSEKLKLNDFSLMTEGEMKLVVGGYDAPYPGGTGTGYPGLPGTGTYNDPFQLPEIVVHGNPCNGYPPCPAGGAYSCQGKACGEDCIRTDGTRGTCHVYSAGIPPCKMCMAG